MKRLLLTLMFLIPAIGCTTLTPVGPLTKGMRMPSDPKPKTDSPGQPASPTTPTPSPSPQVSRPPAPILPAVEEAPPPPKPSFFISPDEVTPTNVLDAEDKLRKELEQDRRNAAKIQPPAEVSVIPGKR